MCLMAIFQSCVGEMCRLSSEAPVVVTTWKHQGFFYQIYYNIYIGPNQTGVSG